jgi:hypothetical protein
LEPLSAGIGPSAARDGRQDLRVMTFPATVPPSIGKIVPVT